MDLISRIDDLAHKAHAPEWIQRHLCDWLDLSLGFTRDELRRDKGYAALAASQTAEEVAEARSRSRRRRPAWADEEQ